MAGKLPLFASAPRAVIYIDGQKVAYAVGLSLNASVNIQEVRILGEFAIQSLEPVAYLPVTGSFQIVRILSTETQTNQQEEARKIATKLTDDPNDTSADDQAALVNAVPNSGNGNNFGQRQLLKHLDPRTTLTAPSFDMEIRLRVPSAAIADNPDTADLDETSPLGVNLEEVPFMTVKDCRLTTQSMNVAPNQLLTQSLEYQGLLLVNEARGGGTGPKEQFDSTFKDGGAP